MACQPAAYLTKLLGDARPSEPTSIRAAPRGDCHTYSDWPEWANYVTA